jgi:hypothetical protein
MYPVNTECIQSGENFFEDTEKPAQGGLRGLLRIVFNYSSVTEPTTTPQKTTGELVMSRVGY